MAPEFSRPLAVERIGRRAPKSPSRPSAEEREALARRFGIPASMPSRHIRRHSLAPRRGAGARRVCRRGRAGVGGIARPFTSQVGEPVVRYYQAETGPGHHPDVLSVESLEDEEPDVISGGSIDLGEIAAESLALALDPYPRKPGEVFQGADRPGG
jgi:hypothetical protein